MFYMAGYKPYLQQNPYLFRILTYRSICFLRSANVPDNTCNDHCLCSESLGVRRQVRWGGCSTGTMSRVSGKAIDRFQCTWIAMIGEMYKVDC